MADWFSNIPEFWRGVVTSVFGGMLLAIGGLFIRIAFRQVRESSRIRKAKLEEIKSQLISTNPNERSEASIVVLINIFKNLFMGNIWWILPSLIPLGGLLLDLLKVVSLVYFWLGLRWIYHFYSAKQRVVKHLEILKGTYGSAAQQEDVTNELRHRIIDNMITCKVGYSTFGIDPMKGVSKILTVDYKFGDNEYQKKFREGDTAKLP